MNTEHALKRTKFRINNGIVIRRINLLRHKYVDLRSVCKVVENEGVTASEFLDAVNYLSESEYIELRYITGKAAAELADADYKDLEAKVSAAGIRLLAGGIRDALVEV